MKNPTGILKYALHESIAVALHFYGIRSVRVQSQAEEVTNGLVVRAGVSVT